MADCRKREDKRAAALKMSYNPFDSPPAPPLAADAAAPPRVSANPFSFEAASVQPSAHPELVHKSNPFDESSPVLATVGLAAADAGQTPAPVAAAEASAGLENALTDGVRMGEPTAPCAEELVASAEAPRESEISPIRVIPPTFEEDMLSSCGQLLASGRHRDLVFQLGDGSLTAHRVIIEARCGQHVIQASWRPPPPPRGPGQQTAAPSHLLARAGSGGGNLGRGPGGTGRSACRPSRGDFFHSRRPAQVHLHRRVPSSRSAARHLRAALCRHGLAGGSTWARAAL